MGEEEREKERRNWTYSKIEKNFRAKGMKTRRLVGRGPAPLDAGKRQIYWRSDRMHSVGVRPGVLRRFVGVKPEKYSRDFVGARLDPSSGRGGCCLPICWAIWC